MSAKFLTLVCSVAFLLAASGANANPINFVLQGVRFSDGGTASGTFTYDPATNQYSNVNITTTTGGVRTGANYKFVCGQSNPTCTGLIPPGPDAELNLTVGAGDLTGTPGFALLFTPFLTAGGTSSVVSSPEANCSNATCAAPTAPIRFITAGAVTALVDYQVGYVSNLVAGDSYINLTNTGVLNGFDPAGRICANVYTFDPSEELISCCSCPVTPDGLHSLSAKQDLVSNTLTPGVPGSIVIKLVASAPIAGACNASSSAAVLESGLRAWATSLHQNTSNGGFEITENVFQPSPLSASELAKLTTYCGFIQANGSGFGICKSCRLGGLGGAQQ
jgi:hypothetical protein